MRHHGAVGGSGRSGEARVTNASTAISGPTNRFGLRRHLFAPLIAGLVACAVALFAWHGADLPNQVYRATLYHRYGLLTFDTFWYGGHYFFTYSLLTPVLAEILGLRGLGILAAIASVGAYQQLTGRSGRAAMPSSALFAVGLAVPLLVGQITFIAGLAFGLWAMVAVERRWRAPVGVLLAVVCTLTSPLAGAFLALALTAWALTNAGHRRPALIVLAAALAPLGVSAVAFPETGTYSFPVQQLVAVLACSIIGWLVVPAQFRSVRAALALYGVAGMALFVFDNPVGGNLVRLGSYLAPAVLVAACWPNRKRALALVLVPALLWQWSTGVYALTDAKGDPTRSAAYFQPLLDELAKMPQPVPGRLEIPFTNQHWESAYVAPRAALARGWERQVDKGNNPLFYRRSPLSAEEYHRWLNDNGVTEVALADAPLDLAGKKEAALLATELGYLTEVWHGAHWTLWTVNDSPGLVSGPARLTANTPGAFGLDASRSGLVTARFRFTRTWAVSRGNACVRPTPDGWTEVVVRSPGRVVISARPLARTADCDDL